VSEGLGCARARLAAAFALVLALSGCQSAPPAWRPLAGDDPRPALFTDALRALAAERHALRATARVSSDGPDGAGFSKQLLLVERPARLRVEVIGLLEQRLLVLATDGERYDLYRAEGQHFESGAVHPDVLAEVAGLPLTPDAAAALLLATPLAPDEAPHESREDATGALSLSWPDQTLDFDATGRLLALAFHPGRREVLHARWSEWRETKAPGASFPHRLELELFEPEAHWTLDYRQVELDPELAPELFRLQPSRR
jgi:hypothetical protein